MNLKNLVICFKEQYKDLKEDIEQIYKDYSYYTEDEIQNTQAMHDIRTTGDRMIIDLGIILGCIDQDQYYNKEIIKELCELIDRIDKLIL